MRLNTVVIISLMCFTHCRKPDEVVETVIQTDTLTVNTTDTIYQEVATDTGVVVFLVRHAETTGGGSNPHLSAKGLERADKLAYILKNNQLSAVYSTSYFRTQESAKPVADEFSLAIINYKPSDLSKLSDSLEMNYTGKKVLVVGHSNTTPQLLNLLMGSNTYNNINDTVYDNLFIVHKNKTETKVIQLKY